jgi:hypothetical protein
MMWRFSAKQLLLTLIATGVIAYTSICLYLFLQQRHFVFEPSDRIDAFPSSPDFQLPYQDVQISVGNSGDRLHAWWIPAPTPNEKFSALPNEPIRILKSPKTILFLCGRAGNKTRYNYITRAKALRQLGFDVLVIDLCWAIRTGEWIVQLRPFPLKKHGRKSKSVFCSGLDHLRSILLNLDHRFADFKFVLQFLSCT